MEHLNHGANTLMLKHLTRPRSSSKYRGFQYKKVQVPTIQKSGKQSLVIAWEVSYNDSYIITLSTLSKVHKFIERKSNS